MYFEKFFKKKHPTQPPLDPIIAREAQNYAAYLARTYVSWLSEQVVGGRTANKLWFDFMTECLSVYEKENKRPEARSQTEQYD